MNSRSLALASFLVVSHFAGGALFGSPALAEPANLSAGAAMRVSGTPLFRSEIRDALGRTVIYYMNRPTTPRPILLMIQGSGCGTVIRTDGSQSYSTMFDLLPFAAEDRFTVMAVEKPHAIAAIDGGTTEKCGDAFNRDFTADRWLTAIRAALDDARRQPWIDDRRTLVLGTSEGAVMASLLAGVDPHVTDVALVGGSGTSQLFDFIASAYARCFDRSLCLEDIERTLAAINHDPNSATSFAWGHPYKRWSSFFRVDPANALLGSKAHILIAFGTGDESVPPLSAEVAVAKLLGAGRDVTVDRLADAGHDLRTQDANDLSALDTEYRRILQWFTIAQDTHL